MVSVVPSRSPGTLDAAFSVNPPIDRVVPLERATFADDASTEGVASFASSRTKRLVDIAVATTALVITAPLQLLIAACIRAESPGGALFRQVRIGDQGRPFVMWKFRSMVTDADPSVHQRYVEQLLAGSEPIAAGPARAGRGLYKLTADPRITRVGAWLRRTSLDELPQLVNVLRGEMSIVGPRPALPYEVAVYGDAQRIRLKVRPGMTGLWQTSGRNRLSMLQMCDLDARYVRTCSLAMDLAIILRTPMAVVRPRSAA